MLILDKQHKQLAAARVERWCDQDVGFAIPLGIKGCRHVRLSALAGWVCLDLVIVRVQTVTRTPARSSRGLADNEKTVEWGCRKN
jgi:hypothetical protein